MRHHMCPDEAFGMVFNLDNVIANTKTRQRAAWHRLAELEGLPPPKPDRPLFDLRPERVITEVRQAVITWFWQITMLTVHSGATDRIAERSGSSVQRCSRAYIDSGLSMRVGEVVCL